MAAGAPNASLSALVLEPERRTRDRLVAFLRNKGFDVNGVSASKDLAGLVRSGGYQIALLDLDSLTEVAAPGMIRSIRALDQNPCLLCMTRNPSVAGAVMAFRLGAFDYLKKPVDPQELSRSLEEATRAFNLCLARLEQLPALVGERLRSRRKELGWSLRQVATKSGLAPSQISLAERGGAALTIRTLYRISTTLGLACSELLEGL